MTNRALPTRDRPGDPSRRPSLAAAGAAAGVHALALALLLIAPTGDSARFETTGRQIDVQFFTEAEDPAAEPSAEDADAESEEEEADEEPVETQDEMEPSAAPAPPEPADETTAADADSGETPAEPLPDASLVRPDAPEPPSDDVTAENAPIATGDARADAEPARPTSMADIEARARDPLDMRPEDFADRDFAEADLSAGVPGVVREVFCVSSSDVNLEIGDCPEINDRSAIIAAANRVLAMSATDLEFDENRSRIEYELMQLGADASLLQRVRLIFDTQRRAWQDTPTLIQQMHRTRPADDDIHGSPMDPAPVSEPPGPDW